MTELFVLSPMLILRHIIRKILNKLSKGDVDVIMAGFIILWAVGFDDLFTGVFARCSISSHKLVFVSRKQAMQRFPNEEKLEISLCWS